MSNSTKDTITNQRIIVLDESGYDGSWAESEEGKKRLAEIKELLKDKHFDGYINPELTSTNLTYIPKRYLKWDDLDWCNPALKERYLGFNVRMGDNIYSLHYALDRFGCPCCWLVTIQGVNSIHLSEPFFSDLRLERVIE